ncbi:hypothetical protein [Aquabacterium sp.]|uniref:hypothetical protein n=1 Tax=Aquabacterium sp. TaxID=1872578 RepID=UPI003D6C923B
MRHTSLLLALLAASCGLAGTSSWAHGSAASYPAPAAIAVKGSLSAPPAGVTDLKFREMFKLPIGPKGLELGDKMTSLAGQKVRMVGYMVAQDAATPGQFILSPLPVEVGDEDESLSDDLPASSVFVHAAPGAAQRDIPHLRGLISVIGTLRVGARDEAGGRVSSFQLELDDNTSKLFTDAVPGARTTLAEQAR